MYDFGKIHYSMFIDEDGAQITNLSNAFPLTRFHLLKKNTRSLNLSSYNKDLWHFYSIIFLKKEKLYTKLKYSRTPQYDIVSGGSAALFAGFLGFLICEKFGFELLDSGDFYVAFMYVVFLAFACRLVLHTFDKNDDSYSFFSLKMFLLFFEYLAHLVKFFFNTKRLYHQ